MSLWFECKRRLRASWLPGLCACAIAYFGYHTVQGERGLIALARLNLQIDTATHRLDQLRRERQHLEHQISLLAPDSLDPDMLDEQARHMLGLAHPDDRIITLKP